MMSPWEFALSWRRERDVRLVVDRDGKVYCWLMPPLRRPPATIGRVRRARRRVWKPPKAAGRHRPRTAPGPLASFGGSRGVFPADTGFLYPMTRRWRCIMNVAQCLECNASFEPRKSGRPQRCCSHQCRQQRKNRLRRKPRVQTTSTCHECGIEFDYQRRLGKGGHPRPYCSPTCRKRAKRRRYRKLHIAQHRERNRLYMARKRGKNPEVMRRAKKLYRQTNPQKIREQDAAYRRKFPDRVREAQARSWWKHRAKRLAKLRERKASALALQLLALEALVQGGEKSER